MITFVWLLLTTAVVLVVYAVSSGDSKGAKGKRNPKVKSLPADQKIAILAEKAQSLKLKTFELKTTISALEKVKARNAALQKELENLKKKEAELREKDNQNKKWLAYQQKLLKKEKGPEQEYRNKLLDKEKQLEKEFTKNVNFKREISESQREMKSLEKDIKKNRDEKTILEKKLKSADERIVKLHSEVNTYKDMTAKLKQKEKESEWISKEEYNVLAQEYKELKQQLEIREKELELKGKEVEKVDKERMRLAHQFKEKGIEPQAEEVKDEGEEKEEAAAEEPEVEKEAKEEEKKEQESIEEEPAERVRDEEERKKGEL